MATTRGYKFRIYPNAAQASCINRTLGCCRFVYNHFLALRRDEWNANHRSVGFAETCKLLTDLKRREDTSWLKEADSMALQGALRNLDAAFQKFFQKVARHPRFKSKRRHQQSYRTRNQQGGIRFDDENRLRLPKLGNVRIRKSRDFEGRILNATITRTASGKYFVSLCVEEDVTFAPCGTGKLGIDVGLKEFFTDSNGETVANPRILRKYQRKLAREQRRLARKMPRSRNRDKQRIRVARVHEHIGNIRKDFLQKLTTRLISENQVIAVEHLQVRNMLRNHHLARSISDASWSAFFRMLGYKATWRGASVLQVDTFYPSSQTCSCCGHQNSITKDLSVRDWTCPVCGTHHDRDENAAKNILARALEQAG